jgi:hypothetical protein
MRSVVAALACLLFLVGCHEQSPSESHSRHQGSSSRPREDASVEPDTDAAKPAGSDSDVPDAGVDLEIDASLPHVNEPAKSHPGTSKPDSKPDAGVPSASQVDAAAPVDAGPRPVIDASEPDVDASPADSGAEDSGPDDSGIDASPDLDAGTDSGSDASPDLDATVDDAATDAATDSGSEPEDAATDAGTDAGPDASTPTCSGPPGLYKDNYCQVLSDGIRAYRPQYPLWSDGATKERYISLPAGTQIDTSNPDRWTFPTGTKFYKMFSWNGVRVETRVLEKTGASTTADFTAWSVTSYAWSADQNSVSVASATGVANALGTPLDIPSQTQCRQCHNMTGADAPIGFNAIQLNHDPDGVTLTSLLDDGLLKNGTSGAALKVTLENALIPGDATARAALGYLHGNCGHCHGGPTPRAGQALWSKVGITDLNDAPIFQTAVCHCLENWKGRTNSDGDAYKLRVNPAHEALSGIIGRMSRRGAGEQMPPVGTKLTDPTGLAAVRTWIESLDASGCDTTGAQCL